MENATADFMRRKISLEEYRAEFEAYCNNPYAGIDLRRAASRLKRP